MADGEHLQGPPGGVANNNRSRPTQQPIEAANQSESPLGREELFLRRLGFSKPFLAKIVERSRLHGTGLEEELLADGFVREDAYFAALARVLQLPFVERLDPEQIHVEPGLDQQLRAPSTIKLDVPNQARLCAIVPSARRIDATMAVLASEPGLRDKLVVTTPSAIRKAVWAADAERRVGQATGQLFEDQPDFSARIVCSGSQGFMTGSLICGLAALLGLFYEPTLLIFHVFLTISYCLLVTLRVLATRHGASLARPRRLADIDDFPVYTVMVALYREAGVVKQLVRRLNQLNWPRARLDIKLVIEADDDETANALAAIPLGREYEVVTVPAHRPRTKPAALDYALIGARGEFVVIYDAEDRPHPDQLREAYLRFKARSKRVVCLQAPLIISNARDSWIAALFALEYSGLFRRLLPMLGAAHHPLPLGGTSNHFRTAQLRSVGAWDPFNVTEDADLGMRFARLGYDIEVISRPTLEDAPTELRIWFGQRTRWYKGWMQTWLVLMRNPVRLFGELGLAGTLMFHMMITGLLVSALGHPLLLTFIFYFGWMVLLADDPGSFGYFLFFMDWFNILASYLVFGFMGYRAMIAEERRRFGNQWLLIPLYWMLLSAAAWYALYELYRKPFFWRKTPHKPSAVEVAGPE